MFRSRQSLPGRAKPNDHSGETSPFQIAVRLFFTCWLIYALHVATNTVREIYLALAIGDHILFRSTSTPAFIPICLKKPGCGWHINANPGASMLGAVP